MKLSDIMSALGLTIYAELALLIFFGVFIGVVLHVLRGREQFEQVSRIPLNDETPRGPRYDN